MKLSMREAAFVARVPVKTLNRAIDRMMLRSTSRRAEPRGLHRVAVRDLLMFVVARRSATLVTLRARAHRQLQAAVEGYLAQLNATLWTTPDAEWHDWLIRTVTPIAFGPITINILEWLKEPFDLLRQVSLSRQVVVCDPQIRGGEPIVRDTRIPVYLLADLRNQGASDDELLDDYPALTNATLSSALLWADLHRPVRGPRRKAPWRGSKGRVLLAASEGPMRRAPVTAPINSQSSSEGCTVCGSTPAHLTGEVDPDLGPIRLCEAHSFREFDWT